MYKLHFHKNGKYDFKSITEEDCKVICTMHDFGERYSNASRYQYSFNGHKHYNGLPLGTAKVCIQTFIIIKKKMHERFDIVKV